MLGGLVENLADLGTALSVAVEPERAGQCPAGRPLGGQVAARDRPALVLLQQRLGVERIDLRRAAVEVNVDDALRLAGEVCWPRRKRVLRRRGVRLAHQPGVAQQGREADDAEAGASAA